MKKEVIIYDGTCNFCVKHVKRVQKKDTDNRFRYVSSTSKKLTKELAVSKKDVKLGLIFFDKEGNKYMKAHAIQQIYKRIDKYHFFAWSRHIPLVKQLVDLVYVLIAHFRYSLYGRCEEDCSLEGAKE